MPRHHEHEYRIAVLLCLVERSQARLDQAQELWIMASQTLEAADLVLLRRRQLEPERQVLRTMVRRHALDEAPQEP